MEDHEETTIENKTAVEDLKLLIESIKYQQQDMEFQEQALKTMASVFRTSDSASSYLVTSDGLEHILRILISSNDKPNSLREACLHALCAACENNAIAQQALRIQEIFCVLKKFVLMKSSTRLQTLSCYLLICLMTNNEKGQTLARKTKCIETLRYLFKDVRSPSCSPRIPNRLTECLSSECQENEALINLWQTATNALSVCVNNPQNSENQLLCSSAFPAAVAYLRNCDSANIQTTTLTFLRNSLANNSRSQVNFRLVGGLRTLCDVFREELLDGRQIPSSVLKSLVLTIDAAVYGNDLCRDSIAELEIVPLLLQSLQLCFASPKFKIQCLITLAACIEGCDFLSESSCKQFFSSEGMSIVVKLLAENQNCEELQKSATCVLHTYLEQTKSTIPEFMDEVLTSDLLRDNLALQAQLEIQENSIQAEGELHEITAENRICYNDSNDIMETKSNVSVEQSDVANRIEDLTKEVRCLKQIFTTKEEHFQKSVTNNLIKRFMDMMNNGSDSRDISLSVNKDGIENNNTASDTCASTSRGQGSGIITNNRRNSDVVRSRNTADSECVSGGKTSSNEGRGIAVQNKGCSKIVRDNIANYTEHNNIGQDNESHNTTVKQIGNVNNFATKVSDSRTKKTSSGSIYYEAEISSNERATNNANDAFASVSDKNTKNINNPESDENTNIVKDNDSVSVGGTQAIQLKDCANIQNISEGITTVKGNDISCERSSISCSQNVDDTLCDREYTTSSSNKSKNSLAYMRCIHNNSVDNNCNVIDVNRDEDQHCQIQYNEVPIEDNMSNVNREQQKYQQRHIPDLVSDFDLCDQASNKEVCGTNNKSEGCRMVEDMTERPCMISNSYHDQTNSLVNPTQISAQTNATGNEIEDFSKNCPKASDGVSNSKEAGNIRYGDTPNNQKTVPTNIRAGKRPHLTTSKQGMSGCRQPKRRLQMSELDDGGEYLSDIEESLSESSDEDVVVTNNGLPVKHAVTSKAPMPPLGGKLCQPLIFKHNQKISPKCLGCRCDFAKVNSRNFLSSLRCSINTCSEHRMFVTNVITALRRYQNFLQTKKRSPDFDFLESPKRNVRCVDSPSKIMRKVKPKKKSSRLPKIPFSTNEIEILKQGVDKYGPRFNMIERYCQFNTKRSAKTLKQKYQSIMKAAERKQKNRCPFTVQEEDNLKEGVLKYGYRWKCILDHYRFKQGRTPQNLKDKWRNLLKTC